MDRSLRSPTHKAIRSAAGSRVVKAGAFILVALQIVILSSCQTKNLTSAKIYIQQDDWVNALEQLELAAEATPQNAEVRFYLGSAYGKSGRFARMNSEYEAAIALDVKWEPKVAGSREEFWVDSYNRGVGAINDKDYAKAIEEFVEATTIDPNRLASMKNLGVSYLRAGREEEAIQAYERARVLDPDDLELSLLIGQLQYNGQRYVEAAEHLQRFLAGNPGDEDALVTLANAYSLSQQDQKALEIFLRVLEVDPLNGAVLANVGRIHWLREEFSQAIAYYAKALEADPSDADAAHDLAVTYIKLERLREALPVLEQAVRHDPSHADSWYWLGHVSAHLNLVEQSERAFAKAKELKGE